MTTLFVIVMEFLQLPDMLLPSAWTLGLTTFEFYWLALVPSLYFLLYLQSGGILMGQGRVKTYTCLPVTVTITIIVVLYYSRQKIFLALIFGTMAGFAFEMLANLTAVRQLLLKSTMFLSTADNFRGML